MFIATLIILDKECISVTIKVLPSYVECKWRILCFCLLLLHLGILIFNPWFCQSHDFMVSVSSRKMYHGKNRFMRVGTCCTRSPFLTWLSQHAQSGRWSSFGKWVWFTESHITLVISFYLLLYLLNLFLIN